jgi:hypothetical protein
MVTAAMKGESMFLGAGYREMNSGQWYRPPARRSPEEILDMFRDQAAVLSPVVDRSISSAR